jgi:hypothetical protein
MTFARRLNHVETIQQQDSAERRTGGEQKIAEGMPSENLPHANAASIFVNSIQFMQSVRGRKLRFACAAGSKTSLRRECRMRPLLLVICLALSIVALPPGSATAAERVYHIAADEMTWAMPLPTRTTRLPGHPSPRRSRCISAKRRTESESNI